MEKNINSYSVYINYEIISQEGKKKDKQLANCFDKLIKFHKHLKQNVKKSPNRRLLQMMFSFVGQHRQYWKKEHILRLKF